MRASWRASCCIFDLLFVLCGHSGTEACYCIQSVRANKRSHSLWIGTASYREQCTGLWNQTDCTMSCNRRMIDTMSAQLPAPCQETQRECKCRGHLVTTTSKNLLLHSSNFLAPFPAVDGPIVMAFRPWGMGALSIWGEPTFARRKTKNQHPAFHPWHLYSGLRRHYRAAGGFSSLPGRQ